MTTAPLRRSPGPLETITDPIFLLKSGQNCQYVCLLKEVETTEDWLTAEKLVKIAEKNWSKSLKYWSNH
jgi:hypothetical protein